MSLPWALPTSLAILLAFGLTSVAQIANESVAGYVRDAATQEAISGARVELRTISGEPASEAALSSNDGQFHVAAAPGNYLIAVERSGYQPTTIVLGNGNQSEIVIVLKRIAKQSLSASPVSTHELSAPSKARSAFEKGKALMASNPPDYDRAIREFGRAIKSFPDFYEAYSAMGIAQFRTGDEASAEASLRKSIALSGGRYTQSMVLLAELLNSHNSFVEAESLAREAIAVDQQSAPAYCQLARALSGLKKPSEAEASAEKARQLAPADPIISLVLGNIHLQEHRYAAAVEDFNAYLGRNPSGSQSEVVRAARDRALAVVNRTREAAQVPAR